MIPLSLVRTDHGWGARFGKPRQRARGWEECKGSQVVTECPAGSQSFAQQTLRTLCLAYKRVDEDFYEEWHHRLQEAGILLQNRARALHQVYEEMEQNLQVGMRDGWAPGPRPQPCMPLPGEPSPCSVCSLPPPPSCWEPQPSRTSSRTGSLKPSSVSSKETSKCGYSQGTSKVGPGQRPQQGRRETAGRELICAWALPLACPTGLASALPPPPPLCPWEGRNGNN